MKKIILPALVLLLVAGFCVFGQNTDSADLIDETSIILDDQAVPDVDTASDGERFFTVWDFIKVILMLIAVILVVYAVFFALKKAGGARYQSDDLIRLLGSQSLTQNNSVHLIEVGARYYLVGCGEGSVSHIADIDDKETIDEIMLKNPPAPHGRKTFSDFFNFKFSGSGAAKGSLQDKISNNSKFMHDQAERLKKM